MAGLEEGKSLEKTFRMEVETLLYILGKHDSAEKH